VKSFTTFGAVNGMDKLAYVTGPKVFSVEQTILADFYFRISAAASPSATSKINHCQQALLCYSLRPFRRATGIGKTAFNPDSCEPGRPQQHRNQSRIPRDALKSGS
jgi:hypothetical protein